MKKQKLTTNITKEEYEFAENRINELVKFLSDDNNQEDEITKEIERLAFIVKDYENVYYPVEKLTMIEIIKCRFYSLKDKFLNSK